MAEVLKFDSVLLGATQEIAATIGERDGNTITVSSVAVYIADPDGNLLRNGVAGTVTGSGTATPMVSYIETFSTGNGYVAGEVYTVEFRASISAGTYYEVRQGTVRVDNSLSG